MWEHTRENGTSSSFFSGVSIFGFADYFSWLHGFRLAGLGLEVLGDPPPPPHAVNARVAFT